MKIETILAITLVVLLAVSIAQIFQIRSLNSKITVNAAASSNGAIDTTGWTANEKMNYEMHGTIPVRLQGGSQKTASSGSGMVGGC